MQRKRTTCNRDCPDACGIIATVDQGRVVRLQGDPEHPITRGFLCYRTNQFLKRQYAADRLTQPLLRRGDGFDPIAFDQAIDIAAEQLLRVRDTYGPAAIMYYASGGSLGVLKSLVGRFFAHFGPVSVKAGDICSGAGDWAQKQDFGVSDSNDIFQLLQAKHIVLWGKNVQVSSPHTIPILKEAKARGAKLLLIYPVWHRTANLCDQVVMPRPGGDFALAMAVGQILFQKGWVDAEAEHYCDHFDAYRALTRSRSLADWCAEADISERVAMQLAEAFGPGKPTTVLVGWGMGRRSNGAAIVRAIDALGAISGNLGLAGGGVSFGFRKSNALQRLGEDIEPPRRLLEPRLGAEMLAAQDPPIRATWVCAGNPVAMLPDSRTLQKALRQQDFVVVVDSFMTDTAREADLVLPAATLLESDDLLGSYGHHWLSASQPVVAPPGEARTDLDIMQALAERVGLADVLANDARAWKDAALNARSRAAGLDASGLARRAERNPLAADVLFADRRFPTPSGRVRLLHEAPAPLEPFEGLRLMALSTRESQCSQWAVDPGDVMTVRVHPDAAAGFADDALVDVVSAIGRLRARLKYDVRLRGDVLVMPKGGHVARGHAANTLIQARTTDAGGAAVFYEERVWLERCVLAD